jgi:hypothetical protein
MKLLIRQFVLYRLCSEIARKLCVLGVVLDDLQVWKATVSVCERLAREAAIRSYGARQLCFARTERHESTRLPAPSGVSDSHLCSPVIQCSRSCKGSCSPPSFQFPLPRLFAPLPVPT